MKKTALLFAAAMVFSHGVMAQNETKKPTVAPVNNGSAAGAEAATIARGNSAAIAIGVGAGIIAGIGLASSSNSNGNKDSASPLTVTVTNTR